MEDQQLWLHGLRFLSRLLNEISPDKKPHLTKLLAVYRSSKESLTEIILAVDAEATCRDCAGQCCLNGKYRMNVFDALSHLDAGVTVLPDFMNKPLCPYGTALKCTMEPGFRPADCVIFICDSLDGRLSDPARSDLATYENTIRKCLHEASRLLDLPVSTPLLLWGEHRFYNRMDSQEAF